MLLGLGLVELGEGDGLVAGLEVVGDGAGGGPEVVVLELGEGLEDALGTGLDVPAGPDCPAQWTPADLAAHFGAAASDTRVSFPDARQA